MAKGEEEAVSGDSSSFRRFSPNSVSTLWGSYGRSKEWCPSRCPSAAPRFDCAGSHRVPFVTTVCGRSGRGILGRFTGCPCTFWSKTWFYVTGAGDRMVLEDGNVSLRGRCKESDTL